MLHGNPPSTHVGGGLLFKSVYIIPLLPVQEDVENGALTLIDISLRVVLPKDGFVQNGRQHIFRTLDGSQHTIQVPLNPGGEVRGTFLAALKHIVILVLLLPDLAGHTEVSQRRVVSLAQRHVRNGPADTAIPIVKGMDADEPEVGNGGFDAGAGVNQVVAEEVHAQQCVTSLSWLSICRGRRWGRSGR